MIKGSKHTLKTRNKMIKNHSKLPVWNKGKVGIYSEEYKKKLSESHLGKQRGENSPFWIKDRTKVKQKTDRRFDSDWKQCRRKALERDNFKCKISNQDCDNRLEVHHILRWEDHPELRSDLNNVITLCHKHHPRKKEEEIKLSPYFKELISK